MKRKKSIFSSVLTKVLTAKKKFDIKEPKECKGFSNNESKRPLNHKPIKISRSCFTNICQSKNTHSTKMSNNLDSQINQVNESKIFLNEALNKLQFILDTIRQQQMEKETVIQDLHLQIEELQTTISRLTQRVHDLEDVVQLVMLPQFNSFH